MRDKLHWLFTLRGRVTQSEYLRAGGLLVALKLTIDWLLCTQVFDRPWSPLVYTMAVPGGLMRAGLDTGWIVLAIVAMPFCWVGAALTVRRLRDAAIHPWCTALFVVPIVNVVLFALGVLLQTERGPRRPIATAVRPAPRWLDGTPVLLGALAAGVLIAIGIGPLASYGGALFLGAPFVQGFVIGAATNGRPVSGSIGQLAISALLCATVLVFAAAEGIVCIVMASPIWIGMGCVGVLMGRAVGRDAWRRATAALLVLPLLQLLEPRFSPPPGVFAVTTELVVRAEPQRVWDSLVTFEAMPAPTELPFRLGVAYPIHATIEGRGVGAVRRCSFNTGDFVEPIEVWDEPRLLRFTVDQCPQPMIEWNPLHEHVHAAHLHGFFAAKRGQFELLPQGDGSTLLRGTTWYAHGLHPEGYWQLWSEWLLHTIHHRVLAHIRDSAERR